MNSLHFNRNFPAGPGLAGRILDFVGVRVMDVVITGAIERAKLQSKCHHQQTNTHFYRPNVLPVANQQR